MSTEQASNAPSDPPVLLVKGLAILTLICSVALSSLSAGAADTTPPDLACGDDKFAEWGDDWAFDIPTAVDEIDDSNVPIEVVSTVTNVISPQCPGLFSVTRTWKATDTSTNSSFCSQTVTVLDTQPPNITCPDNRYAECGTPWAFDVATAVDVCDGTNVMVEVVSTVTNVISLRCPGLFSVTRTWQATDTCGNRSFCNQTVTIVDLEPPEITCGLDRCVKPTAAWMFETPTAEDKCDANNVVIEIVATVTNVINPGGPFYFSVTRTWRATDTCGNGSFCNQTVTVADTPLVISNCVTHWKLDDLSGLTATNAATNAFHGTLKNGPMFSAVGRVGGSLSFDGTNDFVEVADANELEFNATSFSVALWIKSTRTAAQALVEKQHSGFTGMFLLALNRDNLASTLGSFGVWTGGTWIDSNFKGLLDGQWHHLAVTFDGTRFRLYRDGMLDRTVNSTPNYVNTTGRLNIGRFGTANIGWPFQGMMDDIFKCNRVLSPEEIAELAEAPAPVPTFLLTVGSINPDNVLINVGPSDNNGQGNGNTPFMRVYSNNVMVTLTAPASADGNPFVKWQRDGVDLTTNSTTSVTMDANHTMRAVYLPPPPPPRLLNVNSLNPTSGVPVAIFPADLGGQTNGTTPFSRSYTNDSVVTLSAAPTQGPNIFLKWQRNGLDFVTNLSVSILLNADSVMTAVYGPPGGSPSFGDEIGHWKLDDGSGLVAMDSSTNHLDGRLTNGPVFNPFGALGGSLTFDGINDHVVVPDDPLLDFNGRSFTVALWVKTTRTTSQALVEKQHTGFNGMFLLALSRDNLPTTQGGFGLWNGGTWYDSSWRGAADGNWHHLAVTFDGSRIRFYRDGMLDRTVNAGTSYLNTSLPLNFGRFGTANAGWPFKGIMDDIRRYNRALNDAEINALASAPIGLASSRSRVPLRLGGVTRLEDQRIRLQVTGSPGLSGRIQVSSNLVQWTDIGALTVGGDGRSEFIDSAGADQPTRFYRVVAP